MLLALLLALIAGLADVFGGFLAVAKQVSQRSLSYFIAISAGFILAVTFIDLWPEVIHESESGPVLILIGFVTIFILDNFFSVHAHEGEDHDEVHTLLSSQKQVTHFDHKKHLEAHSVWAAFAGLLIHTFFDGAAIAARILVSPVSGILVFIAVLSHKIPEGFSMASIFQIGRFNRLHAFLAATALGASTVAGAMMVFISGNSELSLTFLALATGSFTYIVSSELIPYVSGTKDRKGILLFILGIGLFFISQNLLASIGFAEH